MRIGSSPSHFCMTFLRVSRRSCGFGTGVLILRAMAKGFDRLSGFLAAGAATYGTQAAEAEAAGRPLAAEKYNVARAKAAAHAMAFHRAGWTEFKRPLAPRADGTRKVVWQSAARRRLFDMFALIYWGWRSAYAMPRKPHELQHDGARTLEGSL